jgi:endonuclease/exonuclease/phosphatase family metal-dependent hydrolase
MAENEAITPVGESKSRETKKAEALSQTTEAKEAIRKGPARQDEPLHEDRTDEQVHFSRETAEAKGDPSMTADKGLEDRLAWLGSKEHRAADGTPSPGAVKVKSSLGGFLGGIVDKAKDFGGDVVDGIKDKGHDAIDGIEDKGKDTFNKIRDIGGDVLDTLKDLGGEGAEGIKKLLNEAGDGLGKVKDAVDTVKDLIATKSNELTPRGDSKPPHELSPDGKLNVVAWNLHKGEGPNDKGNPPQLDEMVREMRKAKGDVYNLQEVSPEQAQKIADAMGMKAYFTRTTPNQGDMMLVNPKLDVESNQKVTINGDIKPGDAPGAVKQLGKWLKGSADHDNDESQRNEPRVAQVLRVKTPDGKTATLWNTHMTALNDEKIRENQVEKITDYIGEHSPEGEPVIGGGDLNSRKDSSAIEEFKKRGYAIDGAEIDWISSKNTQTSPHVTRRDRLYDNKGIEISDHPMVIAQVTL